MAITGRDQFIAAMSATAYTGTFYKTLGTSAPVLRPISAWTQPGLQPGAPGVAPSTAATCDASTVGALPVPGVQSAGNTLYLSGMSLFTPYSIAAVIGLYDRVAHAGGFVTTTTTAQPVALSAPARCAGYAGVQAYTETLTASGAMNAMTITYTNSAGVSGRTGTLPAGAALDSAFSATPFQLADGDVGISSVQSLSMVTASATPAGNFALVLARPLHVFASRTSQTLQRAYTNIIDLTVSPCLFFTYTNYAGPCYGALTTVEG
ncbi:MAG: hypothetical protein ABWY93_18855 [Mycobacterium sp.]